MNRQNRITAGNTGSCYRRKVGTRAQPSQNEKLS